MKNALGCLFILLFCSNARGADSSLDEALRGGDIKGGLCVIVGSADTAVSSRFARDGFLVNALSADDTAVLAARQSLLKDRNYGLITVESWRGVKLPYADDIVSRLVVFDAAAVAESERLRVVRPGGEVIVKTGDRFVRSVKPRPREIDEWRQWRHGADRNPVSKDAVVDIPQRIQWLTLQGKDSKESKEMVSANGRCFYLNGKELEARDAFNGLPLWVHPMSPKSLAAAAGRNVFIMNKGELLCLDASSGAERRSYPKAGAPNTFIHIDDARVPEGVLVVADISEIKALAISTGEILWTKSADHPRGLSIGHAGVYYIDGDPKGDATGIAAALDLSTGATRWEIKDLPWAKSCYRSSVGGAEGNGIVVFEAGRFAVPTGVIGDRGAINAVHFVSAANGKAMRDYEYKPAMRHDENPRAFFVDGKIAVHRMERDANASTIVAFKDSNLAGEPETFAAIPPSKQNFYCYPPVATERFFIYGQMQFTDWKSHQFSLNPITRGSCGGWSEGLIPANGMMYIFPKSCGCFSMLSGVGALAPAPRTPVVESTELMKGPAFGQPAPKVVGAGDWIGLRGDAYRSGRSAASVPADLTEKWSHSFEAPNSGLFAEEWKDYPFSAGVLTPPAIAGGMVVLAQPHTHRVFALDEATGKERWSFTAEGRVDSTPTLHEGYCLFGTRLGYVYCLRASDGALVWKLRAALDERRIVQCGQVESPWAVPGSVLVSGGNVYFSAGIHPLADGIRVFCVDPATGTIKWTKTPKDMGYDEKGWHMRNGLEQDYFDLMVRDGEKIAMSRWIFEPSNGDFKFLWHNAYYQMAEGAFMQRGTWSYGYPMNRPRMHRPLLVSDGKAVLGANRCRDPKDAIPGSTLKLFRRDFKPGEPFDVIWDEQPNDTASRIGQYFPANRIAENVAWSAPYPGWIEAMVLAGDHLFVYAKGRLNVYDAANGKLISEREFARPVWDGIAAAHGKLFVTTADGRILCCSANN